MPPRGEDQDGGVVKERYRRVAATDQTTTTLLEDRWKILCTITFTCAKDLIHDGCDMDSGNVRFGSRADSANVSYRPRANEQVRPSHE